MFENSSTAGASARRPFVLSRGKAALLAVLGYSLTLLVFRATFSFLEYYHNYDDTRDDWMMLLVGVVLAILCARTLFNIYQRPKLEIDQLLRASSDP